MNPARHLFAATTLFGSALLFAIEPAVARMLLPATGSVPALWNTCVVFFQFSLLAGYLYSHDLPRLLGDRAASLVHLALLLAAALTLPLSLGALAPPSGEPTLWILRTLVLRVAPVFVLLSTGAPLLQRWYVQSHPGADPAPLTAASNLGSLAALLAYPLLVEPALPLAAQSRALTVLFIVYIATVAACALSVARAPVVPRVDVPVETPLPPRRWLRIAALAFVPSSMMLGLTAHIATDVGSFPLLWVIPLAIYLASFVLVFARPPPVAGPRVIAPFLGLLLMMFLFSAPQVATRLPLVLGHLALFAWCAYLLHGEIARARPLDTSITAFQLAIAVGGALGGMFNALVAPRVFVRVTEYPLAMVLAVVLLPAPPALPDPRARKEALLRDVGLDPDAVLGPAPPPTPALRWNAWDIAVPLLVGALAAWLFVTPAVTRAPSLVRYGLPLMVLVLASIGRRARLALGLLCILAGARFDRAVVDASRTFYGVLRVEDTRGVRRFLHGTTLHGLQYLSPKMRRQPVAYYAPGGPIGQAMQLLPIDGQSVGVVGLGVGMLAVYARPDQRWTFYELDPEVLRMARAHFTWLGDARAPWTVVLGDARRSLSREAHTHHRLLVLDAFSSDAIPTHLLTREAMRVYRARVDARGVLAFHVTNRHVDLVPVLSALARDARLRAWVRRGSVYGPDGPVMTTWVLMARDLSDLGELARDGRWTPLDAPPNARPWTDDFTDVLSAFRWR